MNIETVAIEFPEGANIIFGQSHFIKTVEDLHEVMATAAPTVRFGLAFSEASGPRLVRHSGNDDKLTRIAAENIMRLGCGHTFLIIFLDIFPIHALKAVQGSPEVCGIFCATGNPVTVLVARSETGGGVIGVIDGSRPVGVESEDDQEKRKSFLRMIGHKL